MIGVQWALLWSQQHNDLQIQRLESVASENRLAYAENRPGDYRLLLVGTRAEVEVTAASIRSTMIARDALRTAA